MPSSGNTRRPAQCASAAPAALAPLRRPALPPRRPARTAAPRPGTPRRRARRSAHSGDPPVESLGKKYQRDSIKDIMDKEQVGKSSARLPMCVAVGVILLIILTIGPYTFRFWEWPIGTTPKEWADFATYVGGILTPLLTVVSVLVVLHTFKAQHQASIEALRNASASISLLAEQNLINHRARFEEMLRFIQTRYDSNASDFEIRIKEKGSEQHDPVQDKTLTGDEAFRRFVMTNLRSNDSRNTEQAYDRVKNEWQELWRQHKSKLEPSMRTLRAVFEWIASHHSLLPSDELDKNATTVASQLRPEVLEVFFFYTSLNGASPEFYELANRARLFKESDTDLPAKAQMPWRLVLLADNKDNGFSRNALGLEG